MSTHTAEERYSVDERSYDLAKYFLGDNREESVYRDLAQQIQDCVEDFCREVDREPDTVSEPYKGPLDSNPLVPSWCKDE